jgi:hypothetical protein
LPNNIVLSCASCNLLKSWRNVEDFRRYINELPKLLADYNPKFRLLLRFFDVKPKDSVIFHGEKK